MLNAVCGKARCSGCGACQFVCAQAAIVWQKDACGHLRAYIDETKCVHCQRCRTTCPVLHPVPLQLPARCYALWAQDETERSSSSSGGAAALLSAYFIRQKHIVYGSAVLPGGEVKHIRVTDAFGLQKLKGSKYVYSDCTGVYRLIRQDLQAGQKVLFIGTPCQNAGILKVFGSEPGLYTVNVVCHGVPSMQLLQEQLTHDIKNPAQITSLSFRKGNAYRMSAYRFKQVLYEEVLDKDRWKNMYMELFLRNISFRSSCYQCMYARPERAGDMTLGDFWGLGKQTPFAYDTTPGCSLVTCQSTKGEELLAAIAPAAFYEQRNYQEAVHGNAQLAHPAKQSFSSFVFRKLYPVLGLQRAGFWACLPQQIKYRLNRLLRRE